MNKQTNTVVVVVVCRGNIARSPFAVAVIEQELKRRHMKGTLQVLSRGVQGTAVDPEPVRHPNLTYYPKMYEPVRQLLSDLHIDISKHQSSSIDQDVVDKASILLAMDGKTAEALHKLFPDDAGKIHLFSEMKGASHSIADPEFADDSGRLQIFLDIRAQIVEGFPKLLQMAHAA